jgi:hypothetical protein
MSTPLPIAFDATTLPFMSSIFLTGPSVSTMNSLL